MEDTDLTEARFAHKIKTPKFNETFVTKVRMLSEKYERRGQPSAGLACAVSGSSSAGESAKSRGAKDGCNKARERSTLRSEPQCLHELMEHGSQ